MHMTTAGEKKKALKAEALVLAKKTLPEARGRPKSWRLRAWGSLRINPTILIISVAPIIGISPSGLDIGPGEIHRGMLHRKAMWGGCKPLLMSLASSS